MTEDGSLGGGLGICERSFSIFIRWRKKQRKNKISSSSPSTPEEDWSEQIFGFFLSSTDGRVRSKRSLLLHERNLYSHDSTFSLLLL